jgi:signal transduction histidine kinase
VLAECENPEVTSSRRSGAIHGVLVVAGIVSLVYAVTAALVARGSGTATTYAGHSVALATLFVTAGLALFASGLLVADGRPQLGILSVVAGVLWFAPVWEGWGDGPALVRTLGMLAASFVFPVLVHVVVAASRSLSGAGALLVVATYVLVGVCAVAVVLVRDPYLDPYCWANCTDNVFDIRSEPELGRRIMRWQSWITTGCAAALTVMCVARLVSALTAGPRRHWEVLPGGALLGVATIAFGIVWRLQPLEAPGHAGYATVFVIRSSALVLISAGLAATLLTARLQRRSVSRIVATLDEVPPVGGLDVALARAVGDPSLRIHYWLASAGHFADADGRRLADPAANNSATATPLVRKGQTVAVVTHHSDPADLERGLGAAVRLALDNERLQAEVRSRIRELIESRARIVETADFRRRSLERDLHDGAQQSLLSMSYDLKRAKAAAESCHDVDLGALIDSATVEVSEAFHELRELAHGIYPSVLTAAGLCPAVASLAETSDVTVDVACTVGERLASSVEIAGYLLVAGAVEAAATRSATHVGVTITRTADNLNIEISHDTTDLGADLVHVTDRVGAVGGRLTVSATQVRAELPCA